MFLYKKKSHSHLFVSSLFSLAYITRLALLGCDCVPCVFCNRMFKNKRARGVHAARCRCPLCIPVGPWHLTWEIKSCTPCLCAKEDWNNILYLNIKINQNWIIHHLLIICVNRYYCIMCTRRVSGPKRVLCHDVACYICVFLYSMCVSWYTQVLCGHAGTAKHARTLSSVCALVDPMCHSTHFLVSVRGYGAIALTTIGWLRRDIKTEPCGT